MKRFGLLIMMYLLASFGAGAVEVEIDGIRYDVNTEDKTASVIANEPKYAGEVVIPSSIMVEGVEYAVTCIGIRAFSDCAELTSIAIPPSITFIKQNAFYHTGLTSVHIEDLNAWCKMSFELSRSNPLIEAHHLYLNGQEVKDLVIPEGVSSIGVYAFVDCTSLTSVTFPTSVTSIGHGAFYGCTELHSVNFSEGITSIGAYAFCGCSALTSLKIPSSVTTISDGAFNSCKGIKSVTIPSRVTSIGSSAFSYCAELADVYCYAEAVPTTEGSVFEETSIENATLHVPASAIDAYKASEPWSKFGTIEELDESITDYRPFVEEGKVWKVGWFNFSDTAGGLEYHYFYGDTIVEGRVCKKMMCQYEYCTLWEMSSQRFKSRSEYVGALYEESGRVYYAKPNSEDLKLIYDFASSKGSVIECYRTEGDFMLPCTISSKQISQDATFHGKTTEVSLNISNEVIGIWREGVGYNCLQNFIDDTKTGLHQKLMSCTVGDEVLYHDDSLIDGVTPEEPSEVKKKWLDFTHTVKTRPKAPERGVKSEKSDDDLVAASEEETVTGEYSVKALFVNFTTLAGPYAITITDAAGQEVYRKVVQTSNVVALNTDISAYPKGSYTLTVENEEEVYAALLNINDEDSLSPTPSPAREGSAGAVYNLSGQRLTVPRRGVNIIDGKKVAIK